MNVREKSASDVLINRPRLLNYKSIHLLVALFFLLSIFNDLDVFGSVFLEWISSVSGNYDETANHDIWWMTTFDMKKLKKGKNGKQI